MIPMKKTINGLRVHYYQNKKSKITNFGYRFCFGSRAENKKEYGLFHMLEHNIFKGTESFSDPTEITRFFNERSFDLNAETGYNYTSYYAEGLSSFLLKDNIIKTFTEMIFRSSFFIDEFEKERNPILNEYEMYANDANETFFEISRQRLLGSEYHPILGTPHSIMHLSRDQVYKRYTELYNKQNCVFIIETSKSWNSVEKELLKTIDLIPSGEPYTNTGKLSLGKKPIVKITNEKAESGVLSIYYPIEPLSTIKEKTMAAIVLPIIEKLIYDQFRDREGIPTYSQSCRILSLGENCFINITAFVAPDSTKQLIAKLVKFLKSIDRINWPDKINKMKINVAKSYVQFLEEPIFDYVIGNETETEIGDREERYRAILNADKKLSKNDIFEFLKVFKKRPTIHYMK
jgi:predicted Zn-dependent peptidase